MSRPAPRMLFRAVTVIALLTTTTTVASAGQPLLDSALAYMHRGDLGQARRVLALAKEAYPGSHGVTLCSARLQQDTGAARVLLERVLSDTAASVDHRAQAASDLAGLARVRGDTKRAAERYATALRLQPSPDRASTLVYALIAAGRLDSAAVVSEQADLGGRGAAAYAQGAVAWARRDFERCLNRFLLAYESLDTEDWRTGSSLAGCALCAERLGFVNEALRYRQEFEQRFPDALERSMFVRGFAPMGVAPRTPRAAPTAGTAPARAAAGYTIQIGSFGAPANARKLQDDMREHLDDVRIAEAVVSGKTYYRVRIGSFADTESAERFARERISKLGLSYKVLKE